MSPMYVMMIGLPGSGKTTVAREIVRTFPSCDWCVLSTDDFIGLCAEGNGITYDAAFHDMIGAATANMNACREEALRLRRNIIHDQTNLTAKSRARKFAPVPNDYVRVGIVCEIAPEVRMLRMDARPGKAIPPEIDARMMGDFQAPGTDEFPILAMAESWREALRPYIA